MNRVTLGIFVGLALGLAVVSAWRMSQDGPADPGKNSAAVAEEERANADAIARTEAAKAREAARQAAAEAAKKKAAEEAAAEAGKKQAAAEVAAAEAAKKQAAEEAAAEAAEKQAAEEAAAEAAEKQAAAEAAAAEAAEMQASDEAARQAEAEDAAETAKKPHASEITAHDGFQVVKEGATAGVTDMSHVILAFEERAKAEDLAEYITSKSGVHTFVEQLGDDQFAVLMNYANRVDGNAKLAKILAATALPVEPIP